MTVKSPPTHYQPDLLTVIPDKPLTRSGEARTRYGRVVEEIVCGLLGLTDIPNSGSHDIVFDAHHKPSGTYVEIKSLREKNKMPIYEWRRTKDRDCGVPLVYVIATHRCTRQATLRDVWHTMAATVDTLYVLPAWWVDLEARRHEIRRLVKPVPGSRMGYERIGYADGYRNIPFAAIIDAPYHAPVKVESTVKGLPVQSDALFHASLWPWTL
jgi:hypothetical protein